MSATARAYAVVYEDEEDGGVSAYVPDLAVYVSAPSMGQAKREIRTGIEAYMTAVKSTGVSAPSPRSRTEYVSVKGTHVVRGTDAAAVALGRTTSRAKASAARANGAKGGRPRKAVTR